MILIPHLFIGAIIATKVASLPLIIILSLAFHYVLDMLPHIEYSILAVKERRWKDSYLDFLKIALDLSLGLFLVILTAQLTGINYAFVFAGALAGVLPDILSFFFFVFPGNNLLKAHFKLHQNVHIFKTKNFSLLEKVSTQILVVLLGFVFLLI